MTARFGGHCCIGFPYSLVYEIVSVNEVVVLTCRHVRQDELNWNIARRDV